MPPTPPSPLVTLFDARAASDASAGSEASATANADMRAIPLPPRLATLYGTLSFPRHRDRPHVISNFVSTLDGVVALGKGGDDGAAINGGIVQDRAVMGILRACADAVVIGAATLQSVPRFLLTPEVIFPPLASEYRALRAALGKPPAPLHVVISGRGQLDLTARMLMAGEAPALIVTSPVGMVRIQAGSPLAPSVTLTSVDPLGTGATGSIAPYAILAAIMGTLGIPAADTLVLVEGGPRVLASLLAAAELDELFLTLSPLVAGRIAGAERPGFAMGHLFAPDDPRRGALTSVKRAESALFLRYTFARRAIAAATPPTDATTAETTPPSAGA